MGVPSCFLPAHHCMHCKTNPLSSTVTCHAVQVQLPEQFKHVVCEAMEAAAIPVPQPEGRWEQAAHALKVRPEYAGVIGTLTVLFKQVAALTVTDLPFVSYQAP